MSRTGEDMSRKLRPLATLAGVALISAGCSNALATISTGSNNTTITGHSASVC